MFIRLGYDIEFDLPGDVEFVGLLNVHPSRMGDLLKPDELVVEPEVPITSYADSHGNRCVRFLGRQGLIRLSNSTLIQDPGLPDVVASEARDIPPSELPNEVLAYLPGSRYCEVDMLQDKAVELFSGAPRGWARVETICDWVYNHMEFGYPHARATRTALEVLNEGIGVCRDFQHLAVTFCRCLNIPARYATGYPGDIGVPRCAGPMDFSAWFGVYLENRWWTFGWET